MAERVRYMVLPINLRYIYKRFSPLVDMHHCSTWTKTRVSHLSQRKSTILSYPPSYLWLVLGPDYFTWYFIAGTFLCSKYLSWVMGGQPPPAMAFPPLRLHMQSSLHLQVGPDWMGLLCIPPAWIILQQINKSNLSKSETKQACIRSACIPKIIFASFSLFTFRAVQLLEGNCLHNCML